MEEDGGVYPKIEIRVMQGNPRSPYIGQQGPYVKHSINGQFLDKEGNIVSKSKLEAHIPIHEYDFAKLSKMVPHE